MSTHNRYGYKPSRLDAAAAHALLIEIQAFNADYCSALDHDEIETWPEFFTEDALYRITARENAERNLPVGLVYAEGRGMIHDRAIAISRTQMYAPRHTLHILSNTRVIEQTAQGDILAEANFLLIQTLVEAPSTLQLAGHYYDTFVRGGERGLLLKERQVVYDTSILANDLAYPV